MKTEKKDNVYKMVTNRILSNLMNGEIPWRQTWVKKTQKNGSPCVNTVTGKGYSLLNCMLLGSPGEYASFNQIKKMGGHIKKGSKSRFVIYWGWFIPKERKEEARELESEGKSNDHLKIYFPKYYQVFNMDDVEGVERKVADEKVMVEAEDPTGVSRLVIRDYSKKQGVRVTEKDDQDPAYVASDDSVLLPTKKCFTYEEDYYASLFDCLTHSTAAPQRCDRSGDFKKMLEGEMSVREELVGEIASSMILMNCGLKRKETHTQIDAACQKWITALNNDCTLIVHAVNAAEKASKFILGDFVEEEEAEAETVEEMA